MPFASALRPSLALSLLKAVLANHGIEAEIRYPNLHFAGCIGGDTYEAISASDPTRLIGEWLFAEDLFGDRTSKPDPCLDHVVADASASFPLEELLRLRKQVATFLEHYIETIDWESVALVGFTSSFQQNVASLALAKRIKDRYPDIQIVIGGANCEGEMGIALHRLFPFIDYVCLGEGEIGLPMLASQILAGRIGSEVPGMIGPARRGRRGVAPAPSGIARMDELPFADFADFLEQWNAAGMEPEQSPALLFESARGCWWGQKSHCTFCGLNGEHMSFRAKSSQRVLDEIDFLVERFDPEHIQVVDNIIDMRYFNEVIPSLAAGKRDVTFFFETKANLHKEQVRALAEAGVVHIQPGIESLSSQVLRLMRKGVTALQNIQLLRWCAEFGVRPHWNLLAGFPGEDPENYDRQAQIVPLLTHLTPPSGVGIINLQRFSPLFERAEQHGIRNIRAAAAYEMVYPMSPADLFALAYSFDFDYADGRNPGAYLGNLRREVERWIKGEAAGELRSHVEAESLIIRDTRPVATRSEHRLIGARRAVYEFCDRARTWPAIEQHLSLCAPAEVARQNGADIVAELIAANLLIKEDNLFLSLAVPYNPQVAVRRFARALKMPKLYEIWSKGTSVSKQ